MKNRIKNHFLSLRDESRFTLFLVLASILIGIAMLNRSGSFSIWPDGSQMIDNQPGQRALPVPASNQEAIPSRIVSA
jgi:hypothetical protein